MKKVLISLAIAVVPVAFAGTSSGVIHFQGSIVDSTCVADLSATQMNLSYCRTSMPNVVLEVNDVQTQKFNASKPYNPDSDNKAFNAKDFFNISYATAESLPANAGLSYLVSYD